MDYYFLVIFNIIITCLHNQIKACPVFQCSESRHIQLPSLQCVWNHNVTGVQVFDIQASNCLPNEECIINLQPEKNSSCTLKLSTKKIDKEACLNNVDCYSNICNNMQCTGKQENVLCLLHEECANGLYCGYDTPNNTTFPKKCHAQYGFGASCTEDAQCQNNMGCYFNTTEKNATCVKYLSLPDGSKVRTEQAHLCKSHYIFNNICISSSLQSGDKCLFGQNECKYTYYLNGKEETYVQGCQCSDTYSDDKFCPMASTNGLYESYVYALRSYYGSQQTKQFKHTVRRHFFDYSLKVLKLKTINYPKLRDADECYTKFAAESSILKLLLSLLIVVFLLILF